MQKNQELKYLETFDMSEEQKIKLIENLYKLAHINFNNFVKNDWQIIY